MISFFVNSYPEVGSILYMIIFAKTHATSMFKPDHPTSKKFGTPASPVDSV